LHFELRCPWLRFFSLLVIPAKAGIHLATGTRMALWIPAFAGMTSGQAGPLLRAIMC
jgi:ABC-type Mn2+/Zn2+ transport system permease subunit